MYRRPYKRSWWTRRRKRAARWIAGAFALVVIGPSVLSKLPSVTSSYTSPTAGAPASECPAAAGRWLPSAGVGSSVVGTYQTDEHLITLCRGVDGVVYYDGQVKGQPATPDTHISLAAQQTATGWVAHNTTYTYEISNGVIIVSNNGQLLYEKPLEPA